TGREGQTPRSSPHSPGPADICSVHWSLVPCQSRRKSVLSTGAHDTSWAAHPVCRVPRQETPGARYTNLLASRAGSRGVQEEYLSWWCTGQLSVVHVGGSLHSIAAALCGSALECQ